MYRNVLIILGIITVVLLGVTYFNFQKQTTPTKVETPETQIEEAIIQQTTQFGSKLKNVSLLMSPADVKSQMEVHYGPFLTPQLLTIWQNNPAQALGRNVSSPWPDRIDIVKVTKVGNGSYKVDGNVIEVTSTTDAGQSAAMYPVTLVFVQIDDEWKIAEVQKGAYSDSSRKISVSGLLECLPLKSGEPQTLECALGVAIDQSDAHYALDLEALPNFDLNIGTHVKVDGTLTPPSNETKFMWDLYPIDGLIKATTINQS